MVSTRIQTESLRWDSIYGLSLNIPIYLSKDIVFCVCFYKNHYDKHYRLLLQCLVLLLIETPIYQWPSTVLCPKSYHTCYKTKTWTVVRVPSQVLLVKTYKTTYVRLYLNFVFLFTIYLIYSRKYEVILIMVFLKIVLNDFRCYVVSWNEKYFKTKVLNSHMLFKTHRSIYYVSFWYSCLICQTNGDCKTRIYLERQPIFRDESKEIPW